MCDIDFSRMFTEWRTQRRLEYDKLNGLLGKMMAVLAEIQELAEDMADADNARFLANGMTETTLALDGMDEKADKGES